MFGLFGWTLFGATCFLDNSNKKALSKDNKGNAIKNNQLYYKDHRGNYRLTKNDQKVYFRVTESGNQLLIDPINESVLYNLTYLKAHEKELDAKQRAIDAGKIAYPTAGRDRISGSRIYMDMKNNKEFVINWKCYSSVSYEVKYLNLETGRFTNFGKLKKEDILLS